MTGVVEMQPTPSRARRYRGGCQCGAVRYEVEFDPAAPCELASSVWERAIAPSSFQLLAGEECLTGYQFFADGAHHFFCERCGVRAFSQRASGARETHYSVDLKSLYVQRKLPARAHSEPRPAALERELFTQTCPVPGRGHDARALRASAALPRETP